MGAEPPAGPYAVLIDGPAHLKPPEIARALAKLRKVPFQDVVAQARHWWGIVGDCVEKPTAQEEAGALALAGIPALALPSNLLEDLPAPRPVPRLEWGPGGLGTGVGAPLAWGAVRLVAAAALKETTMRDVTVTEAADPSKRALKFGLSLATGIPIPLGGGSKRVQKSVEETDLGFYLDLVLGDPAARWRVDAKRFDFSCLGAVKGLNTLDNFRTLVMELCRLAPRASRNRGAGILIDSKPVREMGYDTLADLDRECRWLLTLKAIGRP